MTNDRTKLPKWAQSQIGVLERDLDHWRKVAFDTQEGNTDIFIRRGLDDYYYLPRHSHVTFDIGDDRLIEVYIEDDWNLGRGVRIYATGKGHELILTPTSGNVAFATNRDFRERREE